MKLLDCLILGTGRKVKSDRWTCRQVTGTINRQEKNVSAQRKLREGRATIWQWTGETGRFKYWLKLWTGVWVGGDNQEAGTAGGKRGHLVAGCRMAGGRWQFSTVTCLQISLVSLHLRYFYQFVKLLLGLQIQSCSLSHHSTVLQLSPSLPLHCGRASQQTLSFIQKIINYKK